MGTHTGVSGIDVLAVSSDSAFAARLRDGLAVHEPLSVETAGTVEEAIDRLRSGRVPDCIVSDHDLPDTDGVAFLQTVRAQHPTLPVVLFTGEGSERIASRAISAGVTEYLIKDRHRDQWGQLAGIVRDAVAYYRSYGALDDPLGRAKALLNAAHDTIAVVRDGRFEYVNTAGVELTGADSHDRILGRRVDSLFGTGDTCLEARLAAVQTGERGLERLESTVTRSDGVSVPVELTATAIEWNRTPAVVLIVRNVERRKRSETRLRRFRRAVEAAGDAIYLTDVDGTITYVNPAFEEITGYDRSEVVGRTPEVFSSGEMSDRYYERLWTTITNGDVWHERITNRNASGERYQAQQTIAPVFDGDGEEIERFVAIQTDVTERVATKRQLERYREVVERLEDPILLQDLEGEFRLVNEAVLEFSGCSREQLLGGDESAFMDEETAAEIERRKADVLDAEEPLEYEVSPSFERTVHEATFSTRRYPYYHDGELAGTLAICRDVTDLKDRERTLQRYEWAIRGATDLIAAVDRDGQYLFANPQYRTYHGIDREDMTGLFLADVLDEDVHERVVPRVERALAGETVEYRITRPHPARGARTLDAQYYPLEDDGEISGVVAVFRDVTETDERTRQLRVVDRVLRHNLRNELTVVRGLAKGIEDGTTGTAAEDAVRIVDCVDALLSTSEKSRRITTVLSERPTVEPIDVAEVVRTVARSLAERYPAASVDVTAPETATVSAVAPLEEAIDELAVNAVVHNDDEPHLRLAVESAGDDVRVRIVDDGPGIPAMDRAVLEDGEETDHVYHGSGLGLWLVHWIVRRSGGTATVTDVDPGTEVTITLRRPTV